MNSEKFLIDTNSLITPYQQYYPFDFAPSFWSQMEQHFRSGSILLLDMVKNEILHGKEDDDLNKWMKSLGIDVIRRDQFTIIERYGQIMDHLATAPYYQPSALKEWSKDTVADAWLIAAAAVYGYTLITFEVHNRNKNEHTPSKYAKIPDVADEFGVKTDSLFYLMRSLKFKL